MNIFLRRGLLSGIRFSMEYLTVKLLNGGVAYMLSFCLFSTHALKHVYMST